MERTSKAGEATEHVGAPGDRGLNEVEVRSTHKVLGSSHVGRMFFDSSEWQGKELQVWTRRRRQLLKEKRWRREERIERRSESDTTRVVCGNPNRKVPSTAQDTLAPNGDTFLPCSFSLLPHGDCGTNSAGCAWNASEPVEIKKLSVETKGLVPEFTPWR